MRVTRIAFFLALLAALASCGGGADRRDAGGTSSPSVAASASPTSAGSVASSANPFAATAPSSGSSLTLIDPHDPTRPCDAVTKISPVSGVPGGNYIRAITRPPIRWGPRCEVLSPGDACNVQWDGAYTVLVGADAYLQFQAWAKGQDKPFKVLTAGPLPAENTLRRVGFPVTIPKATEVAFRIVLMDGTKTPVAISDSFVYRVNCKPEAS